MSAGSAVRGALALRAVIVAAGAGLILLAHDAPPLVTVLTVLGVVAAALRPGRIGAGPAAGGFVVSWLATFGWHAAPAVAPTIAAAALLYLLHAACALAAFVPLSAQLDIRVWRGLALRAAAVFAVSAVTIAADYVVTPRRGAAVMELAGLLGLLVLVAIPVLRALRIGTGR